MRFNPESDPDLTIILKPATGPQAAEYAGEYNSPNCNVGKLAVKVCEKHIIGVEGDDIVFDKRSPTRLDHLSARTFFDVLGFIIEQSAMRHGDAGNCV